MPLVQPITPFGANAMSYRLNPALASIIESAAAKRGQNRLNDRAREAIAANDTAALDELGMGEYNEDEE